MPRIRSVKPEFFSSEPVGNCSPTSRLLFVALWCMADDEGRMAENPKVIRAFAFPLDDQISSTDVEGWLEELHAAQLVVRYEVDGRKYLCVKNFKEHQHPKRPQESKHPAPPVPHEFPTEPPPRGNHAPTCSPRVENMCRPEGKGEEGKGEEGRGVPPSAGGAVAPRPALVLGDPPRPARSAPQPRTGKLARPAPAPKWPHFPEDQRDAVYRAWTDRLGAVEYPVLIAAIAPMYRPPDDPTFLPHEAILRGVLDYASAITRGRSAPFASPRDCAKRLVSLARNAIDNAADPMARADRVAMILHGQVSA
jgi:hypothetical protein